MSEKDERVKEFLSCLGNGYGSLEAAYYMETGDDEDEDD